MSNVLITKKGMDFILDAHDNGVYIDLRYFVPVYDDRIDKNVRQTNLVSSFSEIADPDLENPFGEILWNQGKYSLSDTGTYLISGESVTSAPGTFQKTSVQTNLFNGVPLSNQISASDWGLPTEGTGDLLVWNNGSDVAGVVGDNTQPAEPTCYFTRDSYYPVYDTSAEGEMRGSFKCVIKKDIGNVKFNKIALYAVQVDGERQIISDIEFFGEAYLEAPAVRSSLGVGFDQFEFDIQVDVSGVSASFEDLFYSSSADYWSHSPGGLYYPNKIGVGMFHENVRPISATMHLRKSREGDVIEEDVPVLRMDYDNDVFVKVDILSASSKTFIGISWGNNAKAKAKGGDIEITVSNWENYCGNAISVIPKISETLTLGNNTNRWREIWLANTNFLSEDPFKNANINIINSLSAAIVVADAVAYEDYSLTKYQIIIGRPASSLTDFRAIRINDLRIDIDVNDNTDLYGAFKGGDLYRDYQDLLIYNVNAGMINKNVYIFAGLDEDYESEYTQIDGQTGLTHKNILNEIKKTTNSLFCSSNPKLLPSAELQLACKGKIGLFGPVEIRNIRDNSLNTSIFSSKAYSNTIGDVRLFIGAGLKETTTFDTISERAQQISLLDPNISVNYQDLLQTDSQIHLIARKILVDSDIVPIRDNNIWIGSPTKRIQQSYMLNLFAGNNPSGFQIGFANAFVETGVNTAIINLDDNTVSQIGQRSDPIDYGFFDKVLIKESSNNKSYLLGGTNDLSINTVESDFLNFYYGHYLNVQQIPENVSNVNGDFSGYLNVDSISEPPTIQIRYSITKDFINLIGYIYFKASSFNSLEIKPEFNFLPVFNNIFTVGTIIGNAYFVDVTTKKYNLNLITVYDKSFSIVSEPFYNENVLKICNFNSNSNLIGGNIGLNSNNFTHLSFNIQFTRR
jgi:hypothetical protein